MAPKKTPLTSRTLTWLAEHGADPTAPAPADDTQSSVPADKFAVAKAAMQPCRNVHDLVGRLNDVLDAAVDEHRTADPWLVALPDDPRFPAWFRLLTAICVGRASAVTQLQAATPQLLDTYAWDRAHLPVDLALLAVMDPLWRAMLSHGEYRSALGHTIPPLTVAQFCEAVRAYKDTFGHPWERLQVPVAPSGDLMGDCQALAELRDALSQSALLHVMCQVIGLTSASVAAKVAALKRCAPHSTWVPPRDLKSLPILEREEVLALCDGSSDGQWAASVLQLRRGGQTEREVALALLHPDSWWVLPLVTISGETILELIQSMDPATQGDQITAMVGSLGEAHDVSWWSSPRLGQLTATHLTPDRVAEMLSMTMRWLDDLYNGRPGVDERSLRALPAWAVRELTKQPCWISAALVRLGYSTSGTRVLHGSDRDLPEALRQALAGAKDASAQEAGKVDRMVFSWLRRLSARNLIGMVARYERDHLGPQDPLPAAITDVLDNALAEVSDPVWRQHFAASVSRQMQDPDGTHLPRNRTLAGYAKDLAKAWSAA